MRKEQTDLIKDAIKEMCIEANLLLSSDVESRIEEAEREETKELGNVLITGTTGFLGAHVLDNFLKVEKGVAYCLVRPEPGLTLENKLIKKLHFYFGDKYDKYIGNRIVIVNADIALNNLGLSNEELERIANDISCIINCAAKVSHFGNYNAYKEINVNGCENLLKFCYQFNKRFYQVSTLSVSGNSLVDQSYIEQSFENNVIFRENNFYINQSLDNVYVRSKFEAEQLVLEAISNGLDGYILTAFILGFPANEIVIPIIIMTYMSQGTILELDNIMEMKQLFIANGWTWVTAINVMIFSLMHWPCSTTLMTIKKETGSVKWTLLSAFIPTCIGIISCILFTSITKIFI